MIFCYFSTRKLITDIDFEIDIPAMSATARAMGDVINALEPYVPVYM